LNRAVQYFNEQPFRQLITFIPNLIQMMNERRNVEAESIALKIAAMRTISMMVSVMDMQQIDSIQKIIPAVLVNMKGTYIENVRPIENTVQEIELEDTQSKALAPSNLLDRNALQQLRPEHVYQTAVETLSSISRANTLANVRIVMKPILE
jgi:hypothetical protein